MEDFDLLFRAVVRTGEISSLEMNTAEPAGTFDLLPNYPNPFNSSTTIPFKLNEPAVVRFSVANSAGQLVRRLGRYHLSAGQYRFLQWDGTDDLGNDVASGFYYLIMQTAGRQKLQKILLVK